MMILSAEYSHGQDQMPSTMLHTHTPRHLYAGYLVEHPWHHPMPMKQEPEDQSVNNDSGISPSHYNSDGSVQHTSPQSCQSDDSGHPDREDHQTNATLGVLARPVMEAPGSPQHASLGLLAQPILGGPHSPMQQRQSPQHARSPGMSPHHFHSSALQRMSPQNLQSVLQQRKSPQNLQPSVLQQRMSPENLKPSVLQQRMSPQNLQSSVLQQRMSPPNLQPSVLQQSPQNVQSPLLQQHLSPQQAEVSPPPSASNPNKPADDNSRSSASSNETDLYYEDPLRGLQMALQRRGMIGPATPEQPLNGEKPLQCPLCPYSTTIRSDFNGHLMSEHSEQVSCHLCEHTEENHMKLREHLRVEHDLHLGPDDEPGSWGDEEEGVTTPKVNSQGKVKTYRCKQCEFSTVTKLDFWEHTRGHIKPERLLTCPKCPFVTEYKHHLEYHLRNHFGSKPFKCDKCSYSCVNKSMLNSHLKSHSNVYQFRCADCAYATKYCHSLKLHLRKYGHNPAMVLNPDGSPNPLPIVDVYGTRRGPKRLKKTDEVSSQHQTPFPMHPMFPNPYGFLPSQTMPYPYNSLMSNFPRNTLLQFPNSHPMMPEDSAQLKPEPDNSFINAAINTVQQSTMNNNQEGVKDFLTRVISSQQEIIARAANTAEEPATSASLGAPLDLSRPDPEQHEQQADSSHDQTSDQSSATKNRRKGKAFKLERIAQRLQQLSSDEDDGVGSEKRMKLDFSPQHEEKIGDESGVDRLAEDEDKNPSSPKVNFCEPLNNEFNSTISEERKARWKNVKEIYDCPYCDMLFGDVVMYTMHMGYHGYKHPYTCNMCGHQTSDRVQFFLHLFRFAHA